MVLFKFPVFVHLTRKLIRDSGVKSEVIIRQCFTEIESVKKQVILRQSQSASAVKNKEKDEEKKPLPRFTDNPSLMTPVSSYLNIEQEEKLDSSFEIHRKDFYEDEFLHGFTPKLPQALDINTEDLSHLGSNQIASFNLAKYADKFPTIQEFVKLGVELWKIDKYQRTARMLLTLDFKRDVKPYIQFLHDCGVPADKLGDFITANPTIFKVDMDDLLTRIRYLRAHEFKPYMIANIVTKNPLWLSHSTQQIDTRLGYFQSNFKLKGSQVRMLAVKMPKLITYQMMAIEQKSFAFRKEMGFELSEMRRMLTTCPRLWTRCKRNLVNTFDYAHNIMNLTHETISNQPHILLCRQNRLETRHKFLVQLKRAQYDPLKPLYVSPKVLVSGTDSEFCQKVAQTSILTYNMFLKSL